MVNTTYVNQLVMKIKLRHYAFIFLHFCKMIERIKIILTLSRNILIKFN